MRAGLAIRQERALAHAYAQPCECCGHQTGQHRELPYETLSVVSEPNPDYRPLHFRCGVEGCDCVIVRAA